MCIYHACHRNFCFAGKFYVKKYFSSSPVYSWVLVRGVREDEIAPARHLQTIIFRSALIDSNKQLTITIKLLSINYCSTNIVSSTNWLAACNQSYLVADDADASSGATCSVETRVSTIPEHVSRTLHVSREYTREVENWPFLHIHWGTRLDLAHRIWNIISETYFGSKMFGP